MRHLVGARRESRAISIGAADQRERGAPRRAAASGAAAESEIFSSRNAKVEGGGSVRVRLPSSGETGKDVERQFQTRLTRAKHDNNDFAVNETTSEHPGSLGQSLKCCSRHLKIAEFQAPPSHLRRR